MIEFLVLFGMLGDPLLRETTAGPVRGIRDVSGGLAWLGIPYAAPPVGPLRWMKPEPPHRWTATRAADQFGSACLQVGGLQGPGLHGEPFGASVADAFGKPVGSEDCLTLNLWRPEGEATGLPIIVFVHGGANVVGYAADPLYHGAHLARQVGAVVVTLNYRLGVLGWFRHPALEAVADIKSASGNFGLLDIISALEFVRSNAEAFGGDPGNVTLVGQSAGAVNALALMVSPGARGLFHRVVALSGALMAVPRAAQLEYGRKVVAELLVMDGQALDSGDALPLAAGRSDEWQHQYLHAKSGRELVAAGARVTGGGLPTADGEVLPNDPRAAVMAGQHMNVPILFGSTASEGNFFVQGVYRLSDAERFRIMLGGGSDAAPELSDLLKPEFATPERFAAAAGAAGKVVQQLMAGTRELFASRVPTFAMEFAWAGQPEPWRTLMGATHGMELPFLFGNFGPSLYSASFSPKNRPGRERLSDAFVASVGTFVRTGKPGVSGIAWRPWSSERATVVLDAGDSDLRIHIVEKTVP